MSLDALKREAAARAVALVRDGMKLGLGTGSTAKHFVDLLAARMKAENLSIVAVPTSEATRAQAASLGIPLSTLDETPELDLTVDGADEIDAALSLIKGGGGAHLREKIVALASKRMVVIADDTKAVATLGRFPLPLEVIPFGLAATQRNLTKAFAQAGVIGEMKLRIKDGAPFRTDSGNLILDAHLGVIPDPARLAAHLDAVTGLVEHGLFIGVASGAFLATATGIKTLGNVA
jgi:ribose 5-phosphate isomerase A